MLQITKGIVAHTNRVKTGDGPFSIITTIADKKKEKLRADTSICLNILYLMLQSKNLYREQIESSFTSFVSSLYSSFKEASSFVSFSFEAPLIALASLNKLAPASFQPETASDHAGDL